MPPMISVPFSDTGVVPEELQRLARVEKSHRKPSSSGKPFWALFYTIPVYHNPTGVSASPGEPRAEPSAEPSAEPGQDPGSGHAKRLQRTR